MTGKALSEETRKALEEFNRLLPEEQIKRLVASGTINAQGEVLMGKNDQSEAKNKEPISGSTPSSAHGQSALR